MSSTRSTKAAPARSRNGPSAGRPDPVPFVTAAARATNEADVAAATALYAPDATMRIIFDGAEEVHRGRQAIEAAWRGYFPTLNAHGFQVEKHLLAADETTIVNDWFGSRRGGSKAYGIEVWRFAGGAVAEHTLIGYLDVRSSTHWLARLRLGLVAPRIGLALLRAGRLELKARQRRHAKGFSPCNHPDHPLPSDRQPDGG